MGVDLTQFHQVFFEESFEGLDAMESALMALDTTALDSEIINTIFRSAHSIKGGSATFGFTVIASFTHVLETLLDEIRSGSRGITTPDVDLFLQSVDCLRDLLTALSQEQTPDTDVSDQLKSAFEKILETPTEAQVQEPALQPKDTAEVEKAANSEGPWRIEFWPGHDILRTGNEPLRMLRELADMGRIEVTPLLDRMPDYSEFDPEACYIGFDIVYRDRIDKSQIEEVFEWVADESQLDIVLACHKTKARSKPAEQTSGALAQLGWKIAFKPGEDILRTGNEPLRILRELSELGCLSAVVNVSCVPDWATLNPESSYLSWDLELVSDASRAQIDEAFEWVVDESDLSILPLNSAEKSNEVVQSGCQDNDIASENSADRDCAQLEATSALPASDAIDNTRAEAGVAGEINSPRAVAPNKKPASSEASSIRVGIDKVDSLINMVGELVITQSMLGQLGSEFDIEQLPKLMEGLSQLEQNTRELQESVMRIRMLPISFAFSRFPRMVRDLCQRLDKKIELELIGEQTELDKTVMEKVVDPLVHLVRNALDHGIEQPQERVAAGKPETGKVVLKAYHQSGDVVIEINDDGKGLDRQRIIDKAIENGLASESDASNFSDEQVYDMIFQPGFSTAQEVSDVSGRGVGMDVVRRNIHSLNGSVEITSSLGIGSKITIRLPLTLAILDGQLVRVGRQTYIFPLVSIVESLQSRAGMVSRVAGGSDVFQLRDEYVPIIRLYDLFNIEADSCELTNALLVVVECDGQKIAVLVDDLLSQQQVVIKSLEQNYQRVQGVSGATILGDGTVALILDVPGLVRMAGVQQTLNSSVMSLAGSRLSAQHTA